MAHLLSLALSIVILFSAGQEGEEEGGLSHTPCRPRVRSRVRQGESDMTSAEVTKRKRAPPTPTAGPALARRRAAVSY